MFLGLFGIIVVPFTCQNMSVHKGKQVWGLAIRIIMIAVLVLSCIPIYILDTTHWTARSFEGLGLSCSVLMFSINFHPVLDYVAIKLPSQKVPTAIYSAIVIIFFIYLITGVAVNFALDPVQMLMTLQWLDYTGGLGYKTWWSYIVSWIVVLFPILSVITAAPVIGISLAT